MIRNAAFKRLVHCRDILQAKKNFSSVNLGTMYTSDFRNYLKLPNGEVGSYFHDVPLELNEKENTVQMVTEVARWSNGKFEISKELDFNPIVQDTKKGKVRFVHNVFPYKGYIHNYGAIPQTWENSTAYSTVPGTEKFKGDNDPLDCCEIGSEVSKIGEISTVKVLGSLALIDDGELDWKVIVINVKDPIASKVNNLQDVQSNFPGLLDATREWFGVYKIPDGKSRNTFAFEGEYKNVKDTINVIKECHEAWNLLTTGKLHTEYPNLPSIKKAGFGIVLEDEHKAPQEIPKHVHVWHYVK